MTNGVVTYTTHMQIMALLVAAQVEKSGLDSVSRHYIGKAEELARSIINRSREVTPEPRQQSRGPG